MSMHTLKIKLRIRKCKNFEFFYLMDSGSNHKQSKDFFHNDGHFYQPLFPNYRKAENISEIPSNIGDEDIIIRWQKAENSHLLNESESIKAVRATEKLLLHYLDVFDTQKKAKATTQAELFKFAQKYGWPFAPLGHQDGTSLASLKRQFHTALSMKGILEGSWDNQNGVLLHEIRRNLQDARRDYGKSQLVLNYQSFELAPEVVLPELQLFVMNNEELRDSLIGEYNESSARSILASETLASVMKYISKRTSVWSATWADFTMEIPCPIAYCLLQIKRPSITSTRDCKRSYSETPYARASAYFRRRKYLGHINDEQYRSILKEAKKIRDENNGCTADWIKKAIIEKFELEEV